MAPSACRRCTECIGEEHHWMGPEETDDDEIVFVCKHCDYTCAAVDCEVCAEFVPIDITMPKGDGHVCISCRASQGGQA